MWLIPRVRNEFVKVQYVPNRVRSLRVELAQKVCIVVDAPSSSLARKRTSRKVDLTLKGSKRGARDG